VLYVVDARLSDDAVDRADARYVLSSKSHVVHQSASCDKTEHVDASTV